MHAMTNHNIIRPSYRYYVRYVRTTEVTLPPTRLPVQHGGITVPVPYYLFAVTHTRHCRTTARAVPYYQYIPVRRYGTVRTTVFLSEGHRNRLRQGLLAGEDTTHSPIIAAATDIVAFLVLSKRWHPIV